MSFKPSEITREHVLKGIEELKKSNKKLTNGTRWEVVIDDSFYPPKEVMRFARMQYDGSDYWPRGGGWPTNEFLEKMGFEVKEKSNNPLGELVKKYIKHIDNGGLESELYKWKLLKEFKGRPNIEKQDLKEETKAVNFANLIYHVGQSVINHLAEERTEPYRNCLRKLFDEATDLQERINSFNSETMLIYREIVPEERFSHHHDERTISTLLTYHNPDKYTFYKDSFYKKLTSLLGIKAKKALFKYVHYLEIVDGFIEDYINTNTELLEKVKNHLTPDCFEDKEHRILAQDILYQMLDKESEVNYWIFQGSPKIYDAVTAINNNVVSTWTVSAHKDKIKEGDKFILWLTGANAGCYALGTITSEVAMMKEEDAEMDYYLSPTSQIENNRVRITIDYNLTQSPILWEMVKEDEAFSNFKGSNQGTNFTATKEQYDTFLDIANPKNNDYEDVKKILDKDKVTVFLSILRDFVTSKNIQSNDERISFNVRKNKNRLVFIIGNKYAFAIEKRNSKTDFWLIAKEQLSEKHTTFINQKNDIEAYWNNISNIEKVKPLIDNEFLIELNKNSKCPYRKFTNQYFINDVYQNKENMENKTVNNQLALNQILYGPPGTGKTYTLKKDYFPKYTLKETSITKELFFEETVRSLTWWQVIALALLENGTSRVNDILTNRWVALKAALSESKNVRATLWGTLQMHTIQESETVAYTQRQTPLIFDKKEDKSWMLLEAELKEQSPELYEVLDSVNNFKANPQKEIKHYVFTTFHQSFSYEDFIEGIKPKMEDETETNELAYKIEPGIFKELCSRAQSDPANRYAIFIDEINRGNVSQIFGELITLIETDKRLGAVNEMKVKLPYSKKEFGVPSNVDIYGTMNTADRSVEALDTALRRRFSFKELMPNSKVVEEKGFSDYLRKEIMEKINNRIELLLDRNHTLGHAYFIKENFVNSFENEIIPLLQEYFYNDYGKIGLVLGKGFVREKSISTTRDKTIFADFETKNEVDIVKSYELIPFNEVEVVFEKAIETLLA